MSHRIRQIIERINPIMLVTNPPVAMPVGKIFFCLTEKTIPRILQTIPSMGNQQKIMLTIPRTILAIPIPVSFLADFAIFQKIYLNI